MFPFTLPGPSFLAFLVVFAVAVIFGYWIFIRTVAARGGAAPRLNELASNPYQLAYLRGGFAELVQVAVFNLADRDLLSVVGSQVKSARGKGDAYVRQPIDKAILSACPSLRDAAKLATDPDVKRAAQGYDEALRKKGLLLDEGAQRLARSGLYVALALILGVAGIRLAQALSRGQHNLAGLFLLTGISVLLVYLVSRARVTNTGRNALQGLAALLKRGKGAERLRPGGATSEALLWAAVFGVFALPSTAFGFIHDLYPRPASSDSGGGSDGGGSDGGSSCGGGGGCGGCGG
jgi:uncharacterized protein (TIGR04222 family)